MERETKVLIVSSIIASFVIRGVSYFYENKAITFPLGIIYIILQLLVISIVVFGFFYLLTFITNKLR